MIKSEKIYDFDAAALKCATGNSAVADIISEKQYEQIFVEIRKMPWEGTYVKIWTALRKKRWVSFIAYNTLTISQIGLPKS